MGTWAPLARVATVISCVVGASACSRSTHDANAIAAEADARANEPIPVSSFPALPPPPPDEPRNPLEMPLKHDTPTHATRKEPVDPCQVVDPKGPLAMRLKHDRDGGARRNPLCMPIK